METTVIPTNSNHLRLHVEDEFVSNDISLLGIPALESACDAIEQLTGFELRYEADADVINDALWSTLLVGSTAGTFGCLGVLPNSQPKSSQSILDSTAQLVESIGDLTEELVSTQLALSDREAELAMAIPVVATTDDARHLQSRLQAILRGLCEGLACQAAAAYMLDDTTSYLKMRCPFGLPPSRLADKPRQLRGSVADLEALTGHAVVIEDVSTLPHWNIPESFASAVCVPIASASTLLGTLWLFCDRVRDFTSEETNLAEIVSGRISTELERTVLIDQSRQGRQAQQLCEEITHWQEDRDLLVPPMLDDWDITAVVGSGETCNFDFYHWRLFDNDSLGLAVGGVAGNDGGAMLTKTSAQAALQMGMQYSWRPEDVLGDLNEFSWSNFTGDHFTSMFYGVIDSASGEFQFSSAGSSVGYILRPHGWEPLGDENPLLGLDPDSTYDCERTLVAPGDVVLLISDRSISDGSSFNTTAIAERLLLHVDRPAEELATIADKMIAKHRNDSGSTAAADRPVVMIIKRRG
ncbi:MAG: SpoIIE family protein phosphatase [Planctomycetales bacterium]|nr:SpoIIE family protein phosphatase [Planctomycetales bacterium]